VDLVTAERGVSPDMLDRKIVGLINRLQFITCYQFTNLKIPGERVSEITRGVFHDHRMKWEFYIGTVIGKCIETPFQTPTDELITRPLLSHAVALVPCLLDPAEFVNEFVASFQCRAFHFSRQQCQYDAFLIQQFQNYFGQGLEELSHEKMMAVEESNSVLYT
jgi:hypothetical protein